MPSPFETAHLNLEQARDMRLAGASYREIGRTLGLSSSQLSHIRKALKRAKAARTRLLTTSPGSTEGDLPVSQSVLPSGLRRSLAASGLRTLGDIAARLADPDLAGLEALPGIGPHKARLVRGLLDHHGLLPSPHDLRAAVEALFPELEETAAGTAPEDRQDDSEGVLSHRERSGRPFV